MSWNQNDFPVTFEGASLEYVTYRLEKLIQSLNGFTQLEHSRVLTDDEMTDKAILLTLIDHAYARGAEICGSYEAFQEAFEDSVEPSNDVFP